MNKQPSWIERQKAKANLRAQMTFGDALKKDLQEMGLSGLLFRIAIAGFMILGFVFWLQNVTASEYSTPQSTDLMPSNQVTPKPADKDTTATALESQTQSSKKAEPGEDVSRQDLAAEVDLIVVAGSSYEEIGGDPNLLPPAGNREEGDMGNKTNSQETLVTEGKTADSLSVPSDVVLSELLKRSQAYYQPREANSNQGSYSEDASRHDGGILRQATGHQWVQSTYANKLATASDIVFAVNKTRNQLLAEQVVICMDEALDEPMVRDQSIASLSSMCLLLLE
ncbi:hypothetical protein ACFO5Q_11730 [Kordiimonas lipolytica]|uniref:Uncharacterized protein n=1 Tax=Kordiimonas lipolytica TaxID=1662421 RepID=A0ABV8UCS6_9PROT|nr:hypothetical protein [Kordiimonas lipolytica]